MKKLARMLLAGALMAMPLMAQNKDAAAAPGALQIAVTYNAQSTNIDTTNRFWTQGGSAQLEGRFWRGLGAVADVAEIHTANMHNSGVGLDLLTATFGPRYTWQLPRKKLNVYGQFLAGEAWGMHSTFPASGGAESSENNAAVLAGGGANLRLNRYLSWRAVEANWVYTHLPNATNQSENSLRLGTGLVIRIP
jgi:outer membrane usher protein FimD/PapC